jgi:hypothetical protein
MYHEKVASQIKFEINQIDKLFYAYEELFAKCKESKPDIIELTALASVLHSFYNGIEKIFEIIAKKIDKVTPNSNQWHRDLLIQMSKDLPERDAVICDSMLNILSDYIAFRHFYRHSYSFFISWNELQKLVYPVFNVWQSLKEKINKFLNETVY